MAEKHDADYLDGYEDGFVARPMVASSRTGNRQLNYQRGYDKGRADREEVNRSGSSNT